MDQTCGCCHAQLRFGHFFKGSNLGKIRCWLLRYCNFKIQFVWWVADSLGERKYQAEGLLKFQDRAECGNTTIIYPVSANHSSTCKRGSGFSPFVRSYVTNVLLSPPSKYDWIIASEASNKNKAPRVPKF